MRLVLDPGTPRDAAAGLRDHGHECVHVGEVGMQNAEDDEILASASTNAVVVTLDVDFHAILAVSGASGPSVIRLRIQGLRAPEVLSLVEKVMAEIRTDLERLIKVKPHRTTCHRLSIGADSCQKGVLCGSSGDEWLRTVNLRAHNECKAR